MDFLRRHRLEIGLFALALLVRVLFFGVAFHAHQGNLIATIWGGDSYYEISNNMLLGHGFSADTAPPYMPNPQRTPGYVLFIDLILLTAKSYWAVVAVQIVIGAYIPLLARRVALHITPSERISVLVAAFMALNPYFILFSYITLTETFFIFLFLLSVLAFMSYVERPALGKLLLSGALLSICALTKPTALYIPLLCAAILLWHFRAHLKRTLVHVALFALVFIIPITPWLYHNYRVFGTPGMSALTSYSLYNYLAPSVLALEQGDTFKKEALLIANNEETITLTNSAHYRQRALAIIAAHPRGLMLSIGTTFVGFFTNDGMLTVLESLGYTPASLPSKPALTLLFTDPLALGTVLRQIIATPFILIVFFRLLWVAITLCFGVGYIAYVRKNGFTAAALLAGGLVLYFALTSILGGLGVTFRYRMPVEPFILTFALLGLQTSRQQLYRVFKKI